MWDMQTLHPEVNEELLEPQLRFQAHWDCTNGIRYASKAHCANPNALPHKHDAFFHNITDICFIIISPLVIYTLN